MKCASPVLPTAAPATNPADSTSTPPSRTSRGLPPFVLVLSLLLLLLLLIPRAALAASTPASTLASGLPGTIGSVLLFPAGLATQTPCDPSLEHDLGCNSWLLRSDSWATWQATRGAALATLRSALGGAQGATVIIYAPVFLFDLALHGSTPALRLGAVVRDVVAAGMRAMLLFGRPEYFGYGNASQTHDVVHDSTARSYLLSCLAAALAVPDVKANVNFVSLYWMGASSYCASGRCSEADIADFTVSTGYAVRAVGPPGVRYLQHVDGPFLDGCWPQPCPSWNVNGYSPASLRSGGADGLLAESWAMGSLVGAVKTLFALGAASASTLLLVNDVPNCDRYPTSHPCSTGSLVGDDDKWFADVARAGLPNATWGVWDSWDCGIGEDKNFYGDVAPNGTALTPKGQLHRARALAATKGANQ